jgi:flavin-dependent dehydrogenase
MEVGDKLSLSREIPIRYEVDVFIAGGGPAGAVAAVAAARQGSKVFLAENHSCFGGMGTAGLVPMFCQFTDGVNFLAGGFGRKIFDRLHLIHGDVGAGFTTNNTELLKRVYDDLITEAGVLFNFHTRVIDVQLDGKRISYAICNSKNGIFAVKAQTFVDCTGDGDLAAMSGADYEKGDEDGTLMPGTLCSVWSNIDWKNRSLDHHAMLEQAFADGVFSIPDRHIPGMAFLGHGVAGANIGHVYDLDGTDDESVTRGLLRGRKIIPEFERYYKEYLKGYENMTLVATASLLGVRETRRILGDYVMSLDDFKKRACFDDEIGRYSYPVDIHPNKNDPESYRKFSEEFATLCYKDGESYGISYRALVPKDLDNVFVAGRCISSDRYIQSSVRVMPACFITGQAAGTAASMLAASNSAQTAHDIDVKSLQRKLTAIGAYLPNFS